MREVEISQGMVLDTLKMRVRAFGTQKEAAKAMGISPQYLGDMLNQKRGPSAALLEWAGVRVSTRFYADADWKQRARR